MSEHSHYCPVRVRFGEGVCARVGEEVKALGAGRVLLVVDPGLLRAGGAERVRAPLEAAGDRVEAFDRIAPNPRDADVEEGAAHWEEMGAEALVAVGGGSTLDTAKGIRVLAANPGRIRDYDGTDRVRNPGPPLLALPTTAGTGSEVTRMASILRTEDRYKMSIRTDFNYPSVALLDPTLLYSLPRSAAAHSGMDALAHAVSGLISPLATPATDLYAVGAIERIFRSLPAFVEDRTNAEAAREMMLAANWAGVVISNARTGAEHALARAVGGRYDLPHGLLCAIFLPPVVEFNGEASARKMPLLAAAAGVEGKGEGRAVARRVGERLRGLMALLGIPQQLSEVGVEADDLAQLARVAEPNAGANPRRASADELRELMESIF